MVVLVLLSAVQPVAQPSRSSDRYGRQQSLAAHITQRVDARDLGLLVLVHNDIPLLGQLDADLLQSQSLRVRVTADRPEQAIHLDLLALVRVHGERLALLAFDLLDLGALVEVDAGVRHPVRERLPERGVERAQDGLAADEHVHLAAERVEHARELDRDVARADDRDALRLLREVEEAVRVDTEARTGDLVLRRDRRSPARRDHNLVGVERVRATIGALDFDGAGGCHDGFPVVELDAFLRDVVVVDAVQAADICVSLGLERLPVELGCTDAAELIIRSVSYFLSDVRCMPHNLCHPRE